MWEVECMREGGEVVSVDHWNVGSLDDIIKQQRVSDYRIYFQVPISQPNISLSTPALTHHTHSHTHTLTHHTVAGFICRL